MDTMHLEEESALQTRGQGQQPQVTTAAIRLHLLKMQPITEQHLPTILQLAEKYQRPMHYPAQHILNTVVLYE